MGNCVDTYRSKYEPNQCRHAFCAKNYAESSYFIVIDTSQIAVTYEPDSEAPSDSAVSGRSCVQTWVGTDELRRPTTGFQQAL